MKAHLVFMLVGMFLITTSCEDDDHDHDHDEDHTDADGFILENEDGTEMYREFEGAMTGSLTLGVGDTLELSVHFLDHEGNEIEHEEEGEEDHEDGLVVSENDANIAVVEVEDHEEGEEGGEEHHEMAIHVIGVSAGSTSFKLQLMHDGHADYTSTNNVPITVN
jgi:activator of 2-hydroxyglutaryl-CoA dehydratase|tara:strand:- start:235 stop:726 length:492 start_codon:yes stop_codon:yes gene_type:complete